MKHLFKFIFVMIFIMTSCEQAETNLPDASPKEAMQSFSSSKEFFDTFDKLSNLEYKEQLEWIKLNGIKNSLLTNIESCQDSVMLEMPRSFQMLFNKDMEVEIEKSIVYFKEGNMYIKSNSSTKPISFGKVEINKDIEAPTTKLQYIVPHNGIGISQQYEFNLPGNKYKFKYVHELKTYGFSLNNKPVTEYLSKLYLILKLEYKGSSWHVAGEPRNIYIDLNICKRNLLNITNNQEIYITTFSAFSTSQKHTINIAGSITHEIVGAYPARVVNGWSGGQAVWSPF